jgi:hypothetical protein
LRDEGIDGFCRTRIGVQASMFYAWRIAKINLATAMSARSSEYSNLDGNHSTVLPNLL